MKMNNQTEWNDTIRFAIIPPDGVGSKGDEAMISGLLNLLQGEKAVLLTPNHKQWCDVLLGKTHLFEEKTVALEEISDNLPKTEWLIVVGADTLDGSCGYEAASWRLRAIEMAVSQGSKAAVFCSIRSDMDERLIQLWKSLPANIQIFLRDTVSEKNFANQVGRPAQHFSDLAFFATPLETKRVAKFREEVKKLKTTKKVIGLQISETMFRSFNVEITEEMRTSFAKQVAVLAVSGMPEIAVVLLTHDTREWDEHWSDYHYACVAQEQLNLIAGVSCIVQPPELTQAELLAVVPELEFVICGRMHMSITACCAGVIPMVVAGLGKNYVMIDKVRGMCREWFGSEQNLLLNLEQMPQCRDSIMQDSQMHALLEKKHKELESTISYEYELLASTLGIKAVAQLEDNYQEEMLLRSMSRAAQLSQMLDDVKCKDAHINQLMQSERALSEQIKKLEHELNDREEECQQLLGKEKRYLSELQEVKYELSCREGECQQLRDKENLYLNELAELRRSRAYRLGNKIAAVARFFVPRGSRRALFAKILVKLIKHPRAFFRKLTPQNFKRFFHHLRKGNITELQRLVQISMPQSLDMVPPEIVQPVNPEEAKNFTKEDYAVLHVPQWEDPLVSIVIPVYNQFDYTYHCIASIVRNSGDITYEIIVGNDCSTDLTTQIDQIITGITCVNNETNLRFVRNCKQAAKYARGKYLLFLNNDTQVQENWLEPLVTLIESAEDIGMVGSKLVYPDGLLQEAGGILWKDGSAWNYGNRQNPELPQFNYVKEADYISGASIMLYRWIWEKIGGFDELFAPAYCDDSDLAFTVRSLGYRVMYQPLSVVVHFEGISNGTDTSSGQKQYQIENSKKLYKKWKDEFAKHPDNAVNVFQARDRSYNRKTLLMVDHYVPHFDKDAGSRTVYQYLKLFVDLGFNVKFIGDNFYRHEPYTTALQQMGIEVLYGPDAAQHWQDWILENAEHIDYVFLNRPHIAPKYLDFIRKNTNAKIIYYGHDLAFLRGMREYEITGDKEFLREAQMWQPKELELMRKSDMAYYPSYVEVDEIHKLDANIQVKAIPAYLFENVQWEGYDFQNRKDIMFIGGFGHRPNVDAVKWVASDVLPLLLQKLPDIKIHILGSNAPQEVLDLANEHLIMEGFVTDEQLAEFYRTSRLSLVPLRYGAGIKGKVIEAMRFGTPVVTTPTGAEGIPNAENALAIEDSADALADRIAVLYNDAEALTQMSKNSIAYIQQNYSPENAVAVIGPEFDLC